MAGSYLLYNELHYNGLMTDWRLCKEMRRNITQIAVQIKIASPKGDFV